MRYYLNNNLKIGGENETNIYVLQKLVNCIFATLSFDLWMSKEAHGIFIY
jgi:hypothetical protein